MGEGVVGFVVCSGSECGLRFPGEAGVACPLCKAITNLASPRRTTPEPMSCTRARPLELLLDNVRSVFNVGSIFRSADGAGARHLYLGGITPTPEHKAMRKTALGAEERVAWSQHRDSVLCAKGLASDGLRTIWALEYTENSSDLFEAARARPPGPLVLVLGNEVAGVDPALVDLCERTVHIAMRGSKASLNVASAMAIAAYALV